MGMVFNSLYFGLFAGMGKQQFGHLVILRARAPKNHQNMPSHLEFCWNFIHTIAIKCKF